MNDFPVFAAELEIRARGDNRIIRGRLPYSPGPGRGMATVAAAGRRRKERIAEDAFAWQIEEFAKVQKELAAAVDASLDAARIELLRQELERRNVHILSGHSYDKPLGDLKSGTARVTSSKAAVEFEVDLPADADMPTYFADTVKQIRSGLSGGVSPGFRVPPATAVAKAETLEPEPGNPAVQVRVINQAVLHELSIVTRPAYSETDIDLRAEVPGRADRGRRRVWL